MVGAASSSTGVPTRLWQRHLGHRDVATTSRIYRHLFADRTNQLVDALDALYAEAEAELSAAAPVVRPLTSFTSCRKA